MKTVKFDLINAVNAGGKDLLLTIDARIAAGSLVFERQYTDSTGETIDVYKSAVGGTCKAEVRIGARIDDEGDTVKTVCLYYRGRVYTSYPIFCGKAQNATAQPEVIETPAAEVNETECAAENIIAEFEADADRFVKNLSKLIDAGTLSNRVFEPITFTSQRTTFDLSGYSEGAKLIVHTGTEFKMPRASKGERVASIELVFAKSAAAENKRSKTVCLKSA